MTHKEIFQRFGIEPKKSLWQNFLTNDAILEKIASFLDVKWKNIIEVWPWYWALTEKLVEKSPSSLCLVELDVKMVSILNERIQLWEFSNYKNLLIHNIDVLKFQPDFNNYLLIANIPYYITSPILYRFFYELENRPSDMLILMQKDVWDKLLKKSKNKDSVLSLYCEMATSEIKEIIKVWAWNFMPPPKVESSVIYFKVRSDVDIDKSKKVLSIIKKWFSEKRKKLFSNLTKGWYEKSLVEKYFNENWIDFNIRAEDFWLQNWIKLFEALQLK